MKHVGITMRVEYISGIEERRDCIDQRWYKFLNSCNLHPILIPNSEEFISQQLRQHQLSGIILTGGNSLSCLGGNAPERDAVEKKIIQYAIEKTLPLIGVCRGMQLLQNFYNIRLEKIQRHVKTQHTLHFKEKKIFANSFHDYGAYETVDDLEILAINSDGVIEALKHKYFPFLGVMWHPEREEFFSKFNIELFKKHFSN